MKITDRFTPPPAPSGAFVPFAQIDRTIYVSGHIARRDGGKPWVGRLGDTMTTEEGKEAARAVALDLLGTLQTATELTSIKRIAKLLVLVNSTPDFTEQHLVANGASELLRELFGEKGLHARSAFGVAQLPFGTCVEIELIAELQLD